MPFRMSQVTYRARNDDGSESAATWKAAQATDWSQLTDIPLRVRFLMDEVGNTAWTNKTWNLFYSLNGGAYTAVAAGQPVALAASGNFAQGDDCTSQLTGGSGTFVTDNNGMCESGGAINSGSANYLFELEYCIQLVGSLLVHGDSIALRIYNGTSAIYSYALTPTVTVSKPVDLTASGIDAGVPALDTPSLTQAHTLVASGITSGAPIYESPMLSEVTPPVALEAISLATGAPVLETPVITQIHGLNGTELSTGAAVLALPAVSQAHALTAAELAAGSAALESPAIGQIHSLAATILETSAPVSGSPVLSENAAGVDALLAAGIVTGNPSLSSTEITQLHVLVIAALLFGTPIADNPIVGQGHQLSAASQTTGYPSFGSPRLGCAGGNHLKKSLFSGIHKGLKKEITVP